MAVEASAVAAILRTEKEALLFPEYINAASDRLITAATH